MVQTCRSSRHPSRGTGYTTLEGIIKYTAGITGIILSKPGETVAEKMEALIKENVDLKEQMEMLKGCILEMSEQVYQ